MGDSAATTFVSLVNDRTEGEGSVTEEPVTRDLAALFAYAHAWSLRSSRDAGRPTLSFSSMLAAMTGCDQPLCQWLHRHLGLRGVAMDQLPKHLADERVELPGQVKTSESFRTALEAARHLADGSPIDVRHFVAAYAVCPDYHLRDFLRLRIDRRAWCLELSDHLADVYADDADERAKWKAFASLATKLPVLAYNTDAATGQDLLHIEREVEAFASLIAAKDTATPMSIGVFGAWGSGKSFFMQRVRRRVALLAARATHDKESRHHAAIAQVEFNAWHYSEGALIACLVDHVFRNLRVADDEDDREVQRRGERLLVELDLAKEAAADRQHELAQTQRRVADARAKLARAEARLPADIAAKRRKIAADRREVTDAKARLAAAIHERDAEKASAAARAPALAALTVARQSIDDPNVAAAERAFSELGDEVRNVQTLFWPIVLGVVALGIGSVVAWLSKREEVAQLSAAIGAAAALLGTGVGWLKKLSALGEKGKAFQEARAKIAEQQVAAVEAAHQPKVAALEAELKKRAAAVTSAEGALEELRVRAQVKRKKLEALERTHDQAMSEHTAAVEAADAKQDQLAKLGTGSLLAEFLDERANSDGYRKHLTLFTQVRNDFERLSKLMERATREHLDEGKPAPLVSRIVLYIDDLDRCPEDKVIEVLRTVHLLLAFPLFVCVVAVDPRWVTACLWNAPGLVDEKQRRWQLGGRRDAAPGAPVEHDEKARRLEETFGEPATPADFLEKIFQIPLWLRPVPAEQRPDIVRALLVPQKPRRVVEDPASAEKEQREITRLMTALARPTPSSPGKNAPRRGKLEGAPSSAELAYIDALAPLLDGNPRALKRFVNTYRLVKSSLSDVELEVFDVELLVLGEGSNKPKYWPYQLCLAQLAVLTTRRDQALRMVALADAKDRPARLGPWLERLANDPADAVLAERIASIFGRKIGELEDVSFETFALWLERTRRYSFYL